MNWWRNWKKREGEIPNGKKQISNQSAYWRDKFQLLIFKNQLSICNCHRHPPKSPFKGGLDIVPPFKGGTGGMSV